MYSRPHAGARRSTPQVRIQLSACEMLWASCGGECDSNLTERQPVTRRCAAMKCKTAARRSSERIGRRGRGERARRLNTKRTKGSAGSGRRALSYFSNPAADACLQPFSLNHAPRPSREPRSEFEIHLSRQPRAQHSERTQRRLDAVVRNTELRQRDSGTPGAGPKRPRLVWGGPVMVFAEVRRPMPPLGSVPGANAPGIARAAMRIPRHAIPMAAFPAQLHSAGLSGRLAMSIAGEAARGRPTTVPQQWGSRDRLGSQRRSPHSARSCPPVTPRCGLLLWTRLTSIQPALQLHERPAHTAPICCNGIVESGQPPSDSRSSSSAGSSPVRRSAAVRHSQQRSNARSSAAPGSLSDSELTRRAHRCAFRLPHPLAFPGPYPLQQSQQQQQRRPCASTHSFHRTHTHLLRVHDSSTASAPAPAVAHPWLSEAAAGEHRTRSRSPASCPLPIVS